MSRYRRQQTPGDNLRDLYAKIQQWVSSGLGDSSIDWDDSGDDGSSLDITVSDTTVAKYGHDGSRHGFLVPVTGGWVTVQEDAQTRADAAQAAAVAAAKTYTDGKAATLSGQIDDLASGLLDVTSDVNSIRSEVHGARGGFSDLDARLDSLASRISALET